MNLRRPITSYVTSVLIGSVAFIVIAAPDNRVTNHTRGGERPSVVFILKDLSNPFFQEMREGALNAAREQNINLVVVSSDDENQFEQQNQLIRDFVKKGVDLILFAPNDADRARPALKEANAARIPLMIVDVPFEERKVGKIPVDVLAQIFSDNVKGGALAARFIAKHYPEQARVGFLEGRQQQIRGLRCREEGFLEEIKKHSHLKVTHRSVTNWEKDKARVRVGEWLKSPDPPHVIFASSDFLVSGVLEAIQDTKYSLPLGIIGYDATREAQRNMLLGRQLASIAQDPGEMGRLAVKYAGDVLRGITVPKETALPTSIVFVARSLQSSREVP